MNPGKPSPWRINTRSFDDEFALGRVSSAEDVLGSANGFIRRTTSSPGKAVSSWDNWHKELTMHWGGFLLKKGRGPVTTWNKRLFELRQPVMKPTSTSPVLVYLSQSAKRDVVLRVKDVKQSMDGPGQPLVLTLDVVASMSEDEADGPCRRMVLSVPGESMSSHFHTKLLMMVEAGRKYRSECCVCPDVSGGVQMD
mmetsp:Transcript_55391/g.146039  ORF Transcript_55391/g.146039 Transcript_55391/m.146039 type:complete len:196 (-) Transcript_55391:322-909(-)